MTTRQTLALSGPLSLISISARGPARDSGVQGTDRANLILKETCDLPVWSFALDRMAVTSSPPNALPFRQPKERAIYKSSSSALSQLSPNSGPWQAAHPQTQPRQNGGGDGELKAVPRTPKQSFTIGFGRVESSASVLQGES